MEMNDDLLISYLLGEVTTEEKQQIENWRRRDRDAEHRFTQFQLIWDTSEKLRDEGGHIDAEASLKRLKERAALAKLQQNGKAGQTGKLQQEQSGRIIRFAKKSSWLKAAAAIVLLAGCIWVYRNQFSVQEVRFLTQEIVKADTLSDGSVVTLNKNSLLRYPEKFRGGQRQVWLSKGEAFFTVTHDKKKPFLIHTGDAVIRVVGTSFNVKNKDGNVEVIVETGIVQVSRNGETVSLRPGEKVQVRHDPAVKLVKEDNPDRLYNYYRSKEFIADDTPLWRMVQVLNEAYDSHIVIGRKDLRDLPLNTTFKNESLDDVLQVISRTFKIKIERKHHQIILY
jgi:transmembrane sensor